MLKEQMWFKYSDDLQFELLQAEDEGRDVEGYREMVRSIQSMDRDDPERERKAQELMDSMASLGIRDDYKYLEPSDIEGIKKARAESCNSKKKISLDPASSDFFNKVYGAWLGRCAGCLLGQPIEGWDRNRITGLLKETGNYPVNYYISSNIPENIRNRYGVTDEGWVYGSSKKNWINNVSHMPEDDDTNYTVMGLKILEQYGPAFTPWDVAESWLANLPVLHVCTAERVAYKNLVNGIYPPASASYRNIYREWIGAQIRADFFGYITPGDPEQGAELAWRDASISHVKNGIYGEMFVAAMISAAAVTDDIDKIIEAGLSQIPEGSRLFSAIRKVQEWKNGGLDWEAALDKVHGLYDEKNGHHWCHTISNAMIVCIGLIYGQKDLERSIGIAVTGAFDTDCNAATVGSIVGMLLGASALPEKWVKPLNDQLKSGVDGFGLVKISDLAARTVEVAKRVRLL